jgi:hypothetical protein
MGFSKAAIFLMLTSPGLVTTAYGQRGGSHGGGGHAGGSFHSSRGGSVGGSVRGGHEVFRGGYYGGRGYYYGGPSIYLGFGAYPYYYSPYGYGYYAYPYTYGYGYDPYAYDPYAYNGGYSAAPPQDNYGYPPQDQRQAGPPPQQQPPPQRQSAPQRQPENQRPPTPQTQPQSPDDQAQWPGAEPESRENNNRGQYYLIAFTDHTIKVATAYKVEGDQFYWMDKDNEEYHVPLSSVDVPFSQQINRDRQVNFQLP